MSHVVMLDTPNSGSETAVEVKVGQLVRLSMPPDTPYPVPTVSGSAIQLVCGTWTTSTKTAVLRAVTAGQAVASTTPPTNSGCPGCSHTLYDLRVTVTAS
ncbi:MAG: hypothetical protein M3Y42_01165 [Actinomycetota bacterium]|nr:hypothetical protein [Actinomycetota bacterium]MDQ2955559.1 hypothetical protein [Actinomycetota bacterium]